MASISGGLELCAHLGIGLEQGEEIALALPDLHGVLLHQLVGVLARHALLRQRDQHALRMHQPAEPVEVLAHVAGIDHELVDHAGEPVEREIERHRGVRPDHALDRGMRNVALVPERDVLHRRHRIGAHHAGEPGEVLRQHRVALVRHGRGALLALRRRIPPPPAPRCAAGGGFRSPAARSTRRPRRASRNTWRGGRAGSPGSRPARPQAPWPWRHAPRPADRPGRRCRPRRRWRRSRPPCARRRAARVARENSA